MESLSEDDQHKAEAQIDRWLQKLKADNPNLKADYVFQTITEVYALTSCKHGTYVGHEACTAVTCAYEYGMTYLHKRIVEVFGVPVHISVEKVTT